MRPSTLQAISVLLSLPLALPALAQPHLGDIDLTVENHTITTRDADSAQQVFGAEMGELFPDFSDEPGFDSQPGTFAPGTSLGFRILDTLRTWDGATFDTPASPQLQIAYSTLSVQTPTTAQAVPGFELAVGSNGEWHRHLEFSLLPPAGDGIYLLQLDLFSTDPALAPSLPFWIVFNNGRAEAEHDDAVRWARAYLAQPACDPDLNHDGNADQDDVAYLINVIGGGDNPAVIDPDFTRDGNTDQDDVSALLNIIAGGGCP